jgi:hypothetical protein
MIYTHGIITVSHYFDEQHETINIFIVSPFVSHRLDFHLETPLFTVSCSHNYSVVVLCVGHNKNMQTVHKGATQIETVDNETT